MSGNGTALDWKQNLNIRRLHNKMLISTMHATESRATFDGIDFLALMRNSLADRQQL